MAKDDKREPRPFNLADLRADAGRYRNRKWYKRLVAERERTDERLRMYREREWQEQIENMRSQIAMRSRPLQVEIVLPKPASPPHQHQAETRSPKSLITAEVERRAAAGERYDSITELSRSLHEWMRTVSDRPLKSRTIENRLREWGLWPLSSKK